MPKSMCRCSAKTALFGRQRWLRSSLPKYPINGLARTRPIDTVVVSRLSTAVGDVRAIHLLEQCQPSLGAFVAVAFPPVGVTFGADLNNDLNRVLARAYLIAQSAQDQIHREQGPGPVTTRRRPMTVRTLPR